MIYMLQIRVLVGHHYVVALGKIHLRAFLTKQYNLVLTKGMISLDGKVTVSLVESNGSLTLGL